MNTFLLLVIALAVTGTLVIFFFWSITGGPRVGRPQSSIRFCASWQQRM